MGKGELQMDKENSQQGLFVLMCIEFEQSKKQIKSTSTFLLYLYLEIAHGLWGPVYSVHLSIQQNCHM